MKGRQGRPRCLALRMVVCPCAPKVVDDPVALRRWCLGGLDGWKWEVGSGGLEVGGWKWGVGSGGGRGGEVDVEVGNGDLRSAVSAGSETRAERGGGDPRRAWGRRPALSVGAEMRAERGGEDPCRAWGRRSAPSAGEKTRAEQGKRDPRRRAAEPGAELLDQGLRRVPAAVGHRHRPGTEVGRGGRTRGRRSG